MSCAVISPNAERILRKLETRNTPCHVSIVVEPNCDWFDLSMELHSLFQERGFTYSTIKPGTKDNPVFKVEGIRRD